MTKDSLKKIISSKIKCILDLQTKEVINTDDINYDFVVTTYNEIIIQSKALDQSLFNCKEIWENLNRYLENHAPCVIYGNEVAPDFLLSRMIRIEERLKLDI